MAEQLIAEMNRRLSAGRDYLAALNKLGFFLDALVWVQAASRTPPYNMELLMMELLMLTTWADNVGPKAVYDLLFEAYDASAIPKDIDPFIVTLISPNTQIAADLASAILTIEKERGNAEFRPMFIVGMMDYSTIPEWIVSYRNPKSTRFDDERHFAAFRSNVAKLAA